MTNTILLRDVIASDLPIFFEHLSLEAKDVATRAAHLG